ncbi:unnamed protein product, partial [Ectocarpus sp. 12 AP-2014]
AISENETYRTGQTTWRQTWGAQGFCAPVLAPTLGCIRNPSFIFAGAGRQDHVPHDRPCAQRQVSYRTAGMP